VPECRDEGEKVLDERGDGNAHKLSFDAQPHKGAGGFDGTAVKLQKGTVDNHGSAGVDPAAVGQKQTENAHDGQSGYAGGHGWTAHKSALLIIQVRLMAGIIAWPAWENTGLFAHESAGKGGVFS
jgi:hypothetical protein